MFTHIPLWVFAVLALLLALGYLQSRTRQVNPTVLRFVALGFLAYSLWGVVGSFGPGWLSLAPWFLGLAVAVLGTRASFWAQGASLVPNTRRVLVPGSWLPLALMLSIFAVKFALGFAAGAGTPVISGSLAAAACALVLGLLSGLFAARARAVASVATQARAA
jgi:hypothetical protein